MSPPQANQDVYLHVRVVISIIVGLCITTLLNGFARFVQHPRRARVSILHLGWGASLLLWVIHFAAVQHGMKHAIAQKQVIIEVDAPDRDEQLRSQKASTHDEALIHSEA